MVIENLPFDKYELEPSPLTQFILSRKQPSTCWQVRRLLLVVCLGLVLLREVAAIEKEMILLVVFPQTVLKANYVVTCFLLSAYPVWKFAVST